MIVFGEMTLPVLRSVGRVEVLSSRFVPGMESGVADAVEGRVGQFLLVVDSQGQRHALAPGSVPAICELEGGGQSVLLLPGGKHVVLDADVETIARALSGETR